MVEIEKENESFFDKNLDNNEDALALRKLYNIFEENQRIKNKLTNNNNNVIKKKGIKYPNINCIIGDINHPKNKYKLKLQTLLLKKKTIEKK